MKTFKLLPLLAALALSVSAGVVRAADCTDAQCWQERTKDVQRSMDETGRFTQQVQVLNQKLLAAREKQLDRLNYLARMQAGLAEVQALLDREFEGKTPEREVLAKLTHEQMLKVKSLTPVLPDTPARLARDARIRELTLELRDAQNRASEQYKSVRTAADPQKAREELVAAMRAEFERSNRELLRLQAEKRAEEQAAARDIPTLKGELERLGTLIKMGEFQDRQNLFASARKALEQDNAEVAALEAEMAALAASKAGALKR